jgi:hypothetical protein
VSNHPFYLVTGTPNGHTSVVSNIMHEAGISMGSTGQWIHNLRGYPTYECVEFANQVWKKCHPWAKPPATTSKEMLQKVSDYIVRRRQAEPHKPLGVKGWWQWAALDLVKTNKLPPNVVMVYAHRDMREVRDSIRKYGERGENGAPTDHVIEYANTLHMMTEWALTRSDLPVHAVYTDGRDSLTRYLTQCVRCTAGADYADRIAEAVERVWKP